jgi:hypothetical protein
VIKPQSVQAMLRPSLRGIFTASSSRCWPYATEHGNLSCSKQEDTQMDG